MEEEITNLCLGKDINIAETTLKEKYNVECYDDTIDDGDGNGGYIMKRCFETPNNTDIILYYSSVTRCVTDIAVR